MTRRATALLLILCASAAAAVALRRDPGYRRMPSPYGTATLAVESSAVMTNITFGVTMPPGDHNTFTVTGWFRLLYSGQRSITTAANYTPEAVPESRPDLLAGAAGFPSGTNLAGAVSVAAFPFQSYTDATSSNQWPRGVYTLAGWSSNAVTVTLGGNEKNVGPGAFNVNMLPGPSAECVVSGTGPAAVGVCLTPDAQFFSHVDGVTSGQFFTAESIVTNELAFCAWRFRLDASNHIYRSDLILWGQAAGTAITRTNAMPRSARAFSSRGIYRVGFTGFGSGGDGITCERFDTRVNTRWLTEAELERVRDDGAAEIAARQIPRWKQP